MLHKVRAFKDDAAFPTVFGMGLLALDVVTTNRKEHVPRSFAGGTCGNVLTALSYLGWHASAISRLAPGPAADRIFEDLRMWSVSTKLVTKLRDGSTPIIIHKIGVSKNGEPYHSFSWRCPECGSHLPGYKPVLVSAAEQIMPKVASANVFFFDRVSRGSLVIAEHCRRRGGIVVFEPSGVNDPGLFREAWRLAHIVKYSHERLRDIADVELDRKDHVGVLLEIETLGAAGLRYRSRLPRASTDRWQPARAFPVTTLRDTAGAGDWCTAGIISRLGRKGVSGLKKATPSALTAAIRYGQALAAWTCGFEGARGGMYEVTKRTFGHDVQRILDGSERNVASDLDADPAISQLVARLCPSCKDTYSIVGSKPKRSLHA